MRKYILFYNVYSCYEGMIEECFRIINSENIRTAIVDQFEFCHSKNCKHITNAILSSETVEDAVKLYNDFSNDYAIKKIIIIYDDNIIYWKD